jgi:septum formation protein
MFNLSHPLVLASQSPRRRQILEMLGFTFTVQAGDVDETPPPGAAAADIPRLLAERKALALGAAHPGSLVLASDTLVEIDGEVLGKPADPEEALRMLSRLNGRPHRVYTGVALTIGGALAGSATGRTDVVFARWPEADLAAYARSGEPLDKAGSYAIQGRGAFLVEKIDGCFYNVMGLPIQETLALLGPFRHGARAGNTGRLEAP